MDIPFHRLTTAKLLTRAQERELAALIAKGDNDARNLLIVSNLRLVISVAKRYRDRGLSMADLISEGSLGLLRAVEKFSLDYDNKFSTYAVWWIKQAIRRAINNDSRAIRIPSGTCDLIHKWRISRNRLAATGPLTDEQIADSAGLTKNQMKIIKHALKTVTIGGRCDTPDGETLELLDVIEVVEEVRPYSNEEVAILRRYIDRLDGKLANIIKWRYGIDSDRLTLDAIGRILGITRERVRQLEGTALKKLKYFIRTQPAFRNTQEPIQEDGL